MDFKTMMANRKNRLVAIQEEMGKTKQTSYSDDRFWKLEIKEGSGSAVIRFLPEQKNFDKQYVEYFRHEFEMDGRWFLENCLTSIEHKCPVCEENAKLWSGSEESKNIARSRKRKKKYVANIYVVKDPANPENEGKVFLYQFGPAIFNMIEKKVNPPEPEFEGDVQDDPVDIYDLIDGCNFRLRLKNTGKYPSYESSTFDGPSPIAESSEEMEAIWNAEYSLKEFTEEGFFKSYDDLKDRYEFVINGKKTEMSELASPSTEETPSFMPKSTRVSVPSSDEDDDMKFFEKMANS